MSAQHVADSCAAGAVCLLGVSLTTIDIIVQIVAGLLTAIAAGVSLFIRLHRWFNSK